MTRIPNKVDTLSPRTAYGKGAVLLGLPFLGLGAFFALAGFEVVAVDLDANAPLWVVGCLGLAFFLAGALLCAFGVRGVRHRARIAALRELGRADRPWLADFPWEERGMRDRSGARVVHGVLATLFFVVFLAPFHWWAFLSGHGPWVVRMVTGFFDLVLLLVAGNLVYRLAQLAKYGGSEVRFAEFPFEPGGRLAVTFSPNRFDRLDATLRFVEERIEETGTGRHRRRRVVSYALWSAERTLSPGASTPEVEIAFDLPDDPALVTAISGTPVRYWELVVAADVPGVDFHATFPLPVYPRGRAAPVAAGVSG